MSNAPQRPKAAAPLTKPNTPPRPSSATPMSKPASAKSASSGASPTSSTPKPALGPQPKPQRLTPPKVLGPQPKPQRLPTPVKASGSASTPSLTGAPKVGAKPGASLSSPAVGGAKPAFKEGAIRNPMRTTSPKMGNKG
ncbi:MAG: hypothetical protein WC718_07010 [Phycisphaerales bacterium]|jgi:hypothetical protein